MPDVIIRRMMEKDLMEVVNIEKQAFSDPWSYESFKSDLNNEMALPIVAIYNDQIVGYSSIYVAADEMQLGNFAVSPDHRKMGIGKLMMDEMLKLAAERKSGKIFLEVRESNVPAISIYSSYGFRAVGRRNGYYRNPVENAIIMVKEL
jgi:[ribosomal protein S18]-alanine N-acetyltransferase